MNLPNLFETYLRTQNCSLITAKNYLADFRHFLAWFAKKTGIRYQVAGKSIFLLFNRETIEEYKNDQLKDNTPKATINRRLSTLRRVEQFAKASGWLNSATVIAVKNATVPLSSAQASQALLEEFKKHLGEEKVSPVSIKNYLSDVRHFLSWLEAG